MEKGGDEGEATTKSRYKQSLQMVNNAENEAPSSLQRRARSMSMYGSQVLKAVNNPHNALFCLGETNPIRRISKYIVESRKFEHFILLAIAANCIVLALNTPLPKKDKTDMSEELENAELCFVVIFCVEALLKILALGFVLHPGAYLRNGWNILDFVVVVIGIISLPKLKINALDVKALRAVRVLRPLKLISGVPSLQVVMKSIMRAMVPLLQIALLVLFCIVIYAIIGLEFLRKNFHYTCFDEAHHMVDERDDIKPCDPFPHPGVREIFHGRVCEKPANCTTFWIGPNDGITTFDNIFLSMLTVFQCITMEGWTHIMYMTFDAIDSTRFLYSIYYVSLIVIGSFFMLNLVLGVLSGEFAKERERVETRRAFFKVRRQQKIERQVTGYEDWIAKAEELMVEEADVQDRNSKSDLVPNNVTSMNVLSQHEGDDDQVNKRIESFAVQEKRFRIKVGRMVKHKAFYWIVIVCVFLNTIIVATEHYKQPKILASFQDYAELVFLTIFFIEMILKMYGLGFRIYFDSTFNCFDCMVVCSGIINIIIFWTTDVNMGVSVLRCVRLLRLFKVTRHWKSLRNLATSLVNSIKSIVSLLFLLFLFILIAALLGMQLFGGKGRETFKEPPRTNFDNFQNAMLAVFQILTGEDWNSVMYYGVKAYGGARTPAGIAVSLYFVLLVILGNYTLLNVFLAIAVDNLANAQILTEDEERDRLEQERSKLIYKEKFNTRTQGNAAQKWGKAKALPVVMALNQFMKKKNGDGVSPSSTGVVQNTERRSIENGDQKPPMSQSLNRKIKRYQQEASRYDNKNDSAEHVEHGVDEEELEPRRRRIGRPRRNPAPEEEQRDEAEDDGNQRITPKNFVKVLKTGRFGNHRRHTRSNALMLRTNTMFLFGPENGFRRLCHKIVNLRHFDNFMLVIIVLSSLTIAVEDPVDDKSERNEILKYFDYVFTGIFLLEVVLKIVDIGVILHKGAYLRNWWNVIDALVVICNTASLVLVLNSASGKGHATVKALRVFRVLRPFKSIHKIKKLQSVFRCMWFSVKNVANILMITVLFLFIFAVMGVQLFNGKFFNCTDASKLTEVECQGQYFVFEYDSMGKQDTTPTVKDRDWQNRPLNFDNVFMAMLTLYTSSTGEGWPAAMHHTMDTTDKDKGPIQNNRPVYAIFYISFVVVFSFFFLNIFVALIILTFQEEGEKEIANCELDRNQRDCIQFALRTKPAQRYMPTNKHGLRYKVWVIVLSKPFDIFIMVLIALNTLVLMMQYYGQSSDYGKIISYCNIAFTSIFAIEALLKLIALKLNYFRDYWNIFDFVIVLGGLMDIIVSNFGKIGDFLGGIDPSMFRLFRAARLIKLLRQGYTIRILLWTFLQSFKALPYVTLLILLMFFMYSVIGMQLFGKIALNPQTEINSNNNFQNFIQGLQVLFRSATGEDWHKIMLDCFNDAPCHPTVKEAYGDKTCGNTAGAIIYFCSFIFLCMFLMLNLFVAVIMDNFEYLTRDESILGPHHLDEFVRVWSEYDPAATGCIHHSEIYMMMCSMTPPVGFGKKCPKIVGYKRLIKMNMPLNDDETVTFSTTLFALVRTSLNIKLRGNMNANDTELRKMILRVWPNTSNKVLDKLIPKESVLSSQQMTIGKIYCAKLIHENYKHMKRKRLNQSGTSRQEEESDVTSTKKGVFRRFLGSFGRKKGTRYSYTDGGIPLDVTNTRRARSNTSDGRLYTRRNSLEYAYRGGQLQRHRNPTPKENGTSHADRNGPKANPARLHQPMAGGSGVEPPVLPATYLNPSPRKNMRAVPQSEGRRYPAARSARDETNPKQDAHYDDVIARINRELATAVEQGQSPYEIYALEEDDEDDWC